MTKSSERLTKLEQQREKIAKKIAREKTKLREAERKRDTRRKIIVGALALEHAVKNPGFSSVLWEMLDRAVTRADDRTLLGLKAKPESGADDAE